MLKWLSGRLRLHDSAKRSPALDITVQESLRNRDASMLRDWMQAHFHADTQQNLLHDLLHAAEKAGWSHRDREKLTIFALYYQGQLSTAFEKARPYLAGDQFDPDIFVIACLTLYHNQQFDDAYRFMKSAEGQAALIDRIDYLTVSGLIHWATNRRKGAQAAYRKGLTLDPNDPTLLFNAHHCYFELGELDDFNAIRAQLHNQNYDQSEAALAIAYAALAENRYLEGFQIMEGRYGMAQIHRYVNPAVLALPRWQGGPLAGHRLLVTAEQGLGDTIMMARYFNHLAECDPSVRIECQPETLSLLTHNFPAVTLVPTKFGELRVSDFDVWTGSMSLPYIFKSSCEHLPGKSGYLSVPPDYREYWQKRVAELARSGCPKIGLAWSGQPRHRADRRRSLSTDLIFALVESLPSVDFFALQVHVPVEHPANLYDISEELVTLADTAALIDQMDLTITVDTSIVHVAGALGSKTWLLLPYRYEWRWGLEGETNSWYDSVRVFRQPAPGAWAPVLSRAFGRDLKKYISSLAKVTT
jgi:tetratricopeptide (TPR) repeat protein